MDNKTTHKDGTIDTALIISLCTILIAVTFFSGNALKNIVSAGTDYSVSAVLWSVIAGFFSVLSMSCIMSLIGKIISDMLAVGSDLWASFSHFMLRFCLYVLTCWIALWGVPFVIVMGVFLFTKSSLGLIPAIVAGSITFILIILTLLKAVPKKAIKPAFSIRPFKGTNKIQAFLFIIICFLIGTFFVNSQYIFEHKLSKKLYTPADVLELDITLKGRILNHDKLTATISMVKPQQIRKTLKFEEMESGKYYSWINLSDLISGLYEGEIFFSNFKEASFINKLNLWHVGNNHLRKRFKFYIKSPHD